MNTSKKLYDFIDKDPVKAFYLGMYIKKWFDLLDKEQQYLHSKLLRHNREEIEPYSEQIKFWTSKASYNDGEEINMIEMSEYIFNNLIWNPDTEEIDKVKVALFLGMIIGQNANLDEEELIFGIK